MTGSRSIKARMPADCLKLFEDIDTGKVLGASTHIRMIGDIFCRISAEIADENKAAALTADVSSYFKQTRGKSSYAVVTALNRMEHLIECESANSYAEKTAAGVSQYFAEADKNTELVIQYGARLLSRCSTVMPFDYSSTVEKTLRKLKRNTTVIIPESRVIGGGYPFVRGCVESGHCVHFIPDADMFSVLRDVDAVVIGAETFYPDGTAFNTAGSDILAELAAICHVPYYVLTPLLKADLRALYGEQKEPILRDEKEVLGKGWPNDLQEKVNFIVQELTPIRPERITAYVTEKGILKPTQLLSVISKETEDD